jgi:hypothetical protein
VLEGSEGRSDPQSHLFHGLLLGLVLLLVFEFPLVQLCFQLFYALTECMLVPGERRELVKSCLSNIGDDYSTEVDPKPSENNLKHMHNISSEYLIQENSNAYSICF